MKKYIILIGLVLLSASVQAKEKGFTEILNSAKKQSAPSREEMQTRKKIQMERMKEQYTKKYSSLSENELEKHKKRLENSIKFAEKNNRWRFQTELDVVNSLLKKE